jgi:adenosyl cobinamide kinase/adenosyl cobinamide phosphate guanylyltransferase
LANNFEAAQDLINADGWKAMEISEKMTKDPKWPEIKEEVMKTLLAAKLDSCPEYREFLMKSRNAPLIEDTTHSFWGRGTEASPGLNKLGQIHIAQRKRLQNSTPNICTPKTNQNEANTRSEESHVQVEEVAHNLDTHSHRKEVLVIGNSHTSNSFSLRIKDVNLEKRSAMTISQAMKEVDQCEKKDVIVLHEITNDIGHNERQALNCYNSLMNLAKAASSKADKVIVSLGLPRSDDRCRHELTQLVNTRIKDIRGSRIVYCNHDNMMWRGIPKRHLMAADGYHLSSDGKAQFASNLTRSIQIAVGSREYGYGNRSGYQGYQGYR